MVRAVRTRAPVACAYLNLSAFEFKGPSFVSCICVLLYEYTVGGCRGPTCPDRGFLKRADYPELQLRTLRFKLKLTPCARSVLKGLSTSTTRRYAAHRLQYSGHLLQTLST